MKYDSTTMTWYSADHEKILWCEMNDSASHTWAWFYEHPTGPKFLGTFGLDAAMALRVWTRR